MGFSRSETVKRLLESHPGLIEFAPLVSICADPDQALLQLARLIEQGVDLSGAVSDLGGERWNRLLHLLGGSRALGDFLVAQADGMLWLEDPPVDPRRELLLSVGADPDAAVPVASNFDAEVTGSLRVRYREMLVAIAAADLASENPTSEVAQVGAHLAWLADAALDAALAIARAAHDPEGKIPLGIIALGKTGAQELNYISDVDVMFLTDPDVSGTDLIVAAEMAVTLTACCSGAGIQPPLWTLDAGLRPEGRDGALVRTTDSALGYYRRWAQNWEFQALLKARASAGSIDLGERFIEAIKPLVWSAASRPGFVRGVREMRQQVEQSVRLVDRDRELKLSAGGLRDVEFTVQLLQLVHGQTDPAIRVGGTLEAIHALAVGGYIARGHAHELADAYQLLRVIEHRAQLQGMRRTHMLPSSPEAMRALARAVNREKYPSPVPFEADLVSVRGRVRELHEDVYYRPIVAATAKLGEDQGGLGTEAAEERLRTIGYVDPIGALRSIGALTRGTSRRAMIQRNLSPVIIQWLSQGADPDMGILSFRTLSEQIGESHWYLALLRDSSLAASRLCQVLSNSRWAEGALAVIPEAVAWLDSDRMLLPAPKQQLLEEAAALIDRHRDTGAAMRRVSALVTREVTRTGLADLTTGILGWRPSVSEAVDVAVSGALDLALREQAEKTGSQQVDMIAVGLGRYGGRESTYASDIDLIFVHRARSGTSDSEAGAAATAIGIRVKALLQAHRQEAMVSTDLDLRPEGRQGAISRTVDSYREYYRRWGQVWERHSMVRARLIAGEESLGAEFMALVDGLRWEWPMTSAEVREIRLLKARMENERLPRGANPQVHVKLGPGGLSDVEWTAQLLQLRYAADHAALRTESTVLGVDGLVALGIVQEEDGEDLRRAWNLAQAVRSANVLAAGQLQPERVDVLPRQADIARRVSTILGYGPEGESELTEAWLYAARRARAVMERYFWE